MARRWPLERADVHVEGAGVAVLVAHHTLRGHPHELVREDELLSQHIPARQPHVLGGRWVFCVPRFAGWFEGGR